MIPAARRNFPLLPYWNFFLWLSSSFLMCLLFTHFLSVLFGPLVFLFSFVRFTYNIYNIPSLFFCFIFFFLLSFLFFSHTYIQTRFVSLSLFRRRENGATEMRFEHWSRWCGARVAAYLSSGCFLCRDHTWIYILYCLSDIYICINAYTHRLLADPFVSGVCEEQKKSRSSYEKNNAALRTRVIFSLLLLSLLFAVSRFWLFKICVLSVHQTGLIFFCSASLPLYSCSAVGFFVVVLCCRSVQNAHQKAYARL